MDINKLFQIADAAKHIQDYSIANAIFAVIAKAAIDSQSFGSTCEPNKEAAKIHFQLETEGDDLIESLSDPDGYGYYDLPRLMKWGEKMMGTPGALEAHVLCIPLPLVSRYFCNMFVRLMPRETHNMGGGIIERSQHERKFWRLSHNPQRVEAWRRFLEEVSQDEIDTAKALILRQHEPEMPEYEPEPVEEQWPGQATLAKLKANITDFDTLEVEEYAEC